MERKRQIKSTDWLTRGMSKDEIERKKRKAIEEFEAEVRLKQIEEIARTLCENGCKECTQTLCADWYKAERLYEAGYRKQSEGEWIICSDGYYPYCSECKHEPKNGVMTDFCPNCGAKMKGGE